MPRLPILPLLLVLAACDSAADADALGGEYDVTLYDDGRAVVATGTLSLQAEPLDIEQTPVSGTWQITRRLPNGIESAASGTVRGQLMGRGVSLVLAVDGLADAGYILEGSVEDDRIRGDWTVGFGPAGAEAPFEARR